MKGCAAERFATGLHQKADQNTRKISSAWISHAAAKGGSKKLHATPQILRISANQSCRCAHPSSWHCFAPRVPCDSFGYYDQSCDSFGYYDQPRYILAFPQPL
jgi:hypothetical protein